MTVVDRVELLRQVDGVPGDEGELERRRRPLDDFLALRCEQHEVPEVVRPDAGGQRRDAAPGDLLRQPFFAQASADVPGAHDGVLEIGA